MLDVVWATEAEADLAQIIDYIGQRDPVAAIGLWHRIQEGIAHLGDHPNLFKASERVAGCREMVVHPNYILIYQVTSKCIEILRVLHARQLFP
jgi:toxin ParE1/3/4